MQNRSITGKSRPPANCPNCQRAHGLEGLAYYRRYVSTATTLVLWIWVRRFLCRHCRISVSCLPQFAQPYRPVNTPTIAAGFNGEAARPEVQRWSQLIRVYWRAWTAWTIWTAWTGMDGTGDGPLGLWIGHC